MIKHVELKIGSQLIDKQYDEWMYILNEFTIDERKRKILFNSWMVIKIIDQLN